MTRNPYVRRVREMGLARVIPVALVVLFASVASAAPGARGASVVQGPAALQPHAPIDIEGNAGFTSANGVVSGQGTVADPYVISNWTVTAAVSFGIQIRNADAYAVLRDLDVSGSSLAGFYFYNVSNVTLENVSSRFNPGNGIRFESSHGFTLTASNMTGNAGGLVLLDSRDAAITGNNLTTNAGDGAVLTGSPNVTLQGNTFYNNGFGAAGRGLDLSFTTGDTVQGNRFLSNGVYLDGDALPYFDSHVITPDNLVGGRPVLYEKDCVGLGLSGMDLGELLLAGCRHARVSNLTSRGGAVGIEVAFGSDVVLGPGVSVSDAAVGLLVTQSTGVQVTASEILDTPVGVQVVRSTDVRIANTKISAPFAASGPLDGVVVEASDRVNVSGDLIRHHRNAVAVTGSGNVTVMDSVLGYTGVGVNASKSHDLRISGNLISQDAEGLVLAGVTNSTFSGNGILAALSWGAEISASSGLRFLRNAFGMLSSAARDANGTKDFWDGGYPTGGNFWRNYTGLDRFHGPSQDIAGPDGIGDTPYPFNVSAVDRYPLMVSPVTADVPPEAIALFAPNLGTVLTAYRFSANLSSDLEDPLASLQVRWSWDDNGTWTDWSAAKSASHVFPTAGVHTVRLEVRDAAGLKDNTTVRVDVLPKADAVPPAILFRPPVSVEVGAVIPISANVTDPSGIANATLLYRGVNGGPFVPLRMQIENNGTNFTVTIPPQPHAGTVDVVLYANDTWANEARAPLSGTASIRIVDTLTPIVVGVVLAGALAAVVVFVFLRLRRRRRTQPAASPPVSPPSPPGNP